MSVHISVPFRAWRGWRLAIVAAAPLSLACSDDVQIVGAGAGQGAAATPSEGGSGGTVAGRGGADPLAGNGGGGGDVDGGGTAGTAATGESWDPPPPLFNRVALDDAALARRALELLGSSAVGGSDGCSTCHTLGRPTLTQWQQLTKSFADDCLTDSALPDAAAVDAVYACFERRGGSGGLRTSDFGIYAGASHLPWFSFVFEHATATRDDPAGRQRAFVDRVGMPRAGRRWAQDELDIVAEWFTRGAPSLFDLVPEDSGQSCQARIDPALVSHVTDMAAQGWRARNAQLPLLMFGCAGGQAGVDCLHSFPPAATQGYGAGWDVLAGTSIRILWNDTGSPTTYWSRCSPDGRYIASGLVQQNASDYFGQIVDLQRQVVIDANFSYDPTFFPDGAGFMLQQGGSSSSATPGKPSNGGADLGDVAVTCGIGVLDAEPASVSGDEPECTSVESQIGLYEQLATSLNGEDYWVLYGAYDGDNGGFRPVLDNPPAAFASASTTTLVPMINQGGSFLTGSPLELSTPLQGDPMLSPSGKLLLTRVKGPEQTRDIDGTSVVTAAQSGYAVHLISTDDTGSGWAASASDVAQLCITGGKPVISFDERWMVLHHYVTDSDATELGFDGAGDPAFAPYRELGASNLYLVDLSNGDARRITNMSAGQYALFPHFRADNWIYFVVRTLDTEEYFAASDAALLSE
jgi:hypothetical protein